MPIEESVNKIEQAVTAALADPDGVALDDVLVPSRDDVASTVAHAAE